RSKLIEQLENDIGQAFGENLFPTVPRWRTPCVRQQAGESRRKHAKQRGGIAHQAAKGVDGYFLFGPIEIFETSQVTVDEPAYPGERLELRLVAFENKAAAFFLSKFIDECLDEPCLSSPRASAD